MRMNRIYPAAVKTGEKGGLASLVTKAELEVGVGRCEEALNTVHRIQEVHPNQAVGFSLAGDIKREVGDLDGAIAAYQTASRLKPSRALALRLSSLQQATGDTESALASLRTWLAIRPADHEARKRHALLLHTLDRRAQAIAEYQRLLVAMPDDYGILNNLAWFYHRQGDSRALETAEKAARIAPQRPEVLDTLGWILVQSNQAHRGLELLERASWAAPEQPSISYHLAVAYERTANPSKAIRELETLLAQDAPFPERPQAQALLARLR